MISATHLIGRHLPCSERPVKMRGPCCFCEIEGARGFPRRQVISSGFMDVGYLRPHEWICRDCAVCLGYQQLRTEWLRGTSFLATETKLFRLKREELWAVLGNPPEAPFVMGVTYSHKPMFKHSSAGTLRPVRMSSSARPWPTIRGSRTVPPSISGTPQRRQ